jgi:hypothetical protein
VFVRVRPWLERRAGIPKQVKSKNEKLKIKNGNKALRASGIGYLE